MFGRRSIRSKLLQNAVDQDEELLAVGTYRMSSDANMWWNLAMGTNFVVRAQRNGPRQRRTVERHLLTRLNWLGFVDDTVWSWVLDRESDIVFLQHVTGTDSKFQFVLANRLRQMPGAVISLDAPEGRVTVEYTPWRDKCLSSWVAEWSQWKSPHRPLQSVIGVAERDYWRKLDGEPLSHVKLIEYPCKVNALDRAISWHKAINGDADEALAEIGLYEDDLAIITVRMPGEVMVTNIYRRNVGSPPMSVQLPASMIKITKVDGKDALILPEVKSPVTFHAPNADALLKRIGREQSVEPQEPWALAFSGR